MAMAKTPCSTLLVLLLASLLLLQAFVTPVASDEIQEGEVKESSEIVDDPIRETFVEANLGPAPGVDTSVQLPKNPSKVLVAGAPTHLVLNITNSESSSLRVAYIRASLHLPNDHRIIVQNFTAQEYTDSVSSSSKASLSYYFSVIKYLQPGLFDLVATVVYELDAKPYKNVAYNGTVEVVEGGGLLSGETLFLVTLGLGLLGLLGMWAYGQVQKFIKKQRRTNKKVETGTRTSGDAASNEWLQGTAITQKLSRSISQQRKSQKKK